MRTLLIWEKFVVFSDYNNRVGEVVFFPLFFTYVLGKTLLHFYKLLKKFITFRIKFVRTTKIYPSDKQWKSEGNYL